MFKLCVYCTLSYYEYYGVYDLWIFSKENINYYDLLLLLQKKKNYKAFHFSWILFNLITYNVLSVHKNLIPTVADIKNTRFFFFNKMSKFLINKYNYLVLTYVIEVLYINKTFYYSHTYIPKFSWYFFKKIKYKNVYYKISCKEKWTKFNFSYFRGKIFQFKNIKKCNIIHKKILK